MKTKHQIIPCLALLALAIQPLTCPAQGVTPYTADGNTVLLEHFEGYTTAAGEGGVVSSIGGPAGLNGAVIFPPNSWLRFDSTPWSGSEGTVEAWIYVTNYPVNLVQMQWFNSDTPPSSGYVFGFVVTAQGNLTAGSWPGGHVDGNSAVPLNTWTHVAVTWNSSGSSLYLNDVLDAFTSSALYAAESNPNYIYVGPWSGGNSVQMDELRISSIRRTDFNLLPPAPPTITNFTSNKTVSSGGSVTLAVGVSGTPPFTYQWFCNGTPMDGATNATLAITNFCPANAGSYTVTVGNALGSATSQSAKLASMDINMFAGIVVNGPVGSNYVIEATSDLAGNWTTLTNVVLPTQPYIYIDYCSRTNRQQFYRAAPVE